MIDRTNSDDSRWVGGEGRTTRSPLMGQGHIDMSTHRGHMPDLIDLERGGPIITGSMMREIEMREQGRQQLRNSQYLCPKCNARVPSIDDLQVHVLCTHPDDENLLAAFT